MNTLTIRLIEQPDGSYVREFEVEATDDRQRIALECEAARIASVSPVRLGVAPPAAPPDRLATEARPHQPR